MRQRRLRQRRVDVSESRRSIEWAAAAPRKAAAAPDKAASAPGKAAAAPYKMGEGSSCAKESVNSATRGSSCAKEGCSCARIVATLHLKSRQREDNVAKYDNVQLYCYACDCDLVSLSCLCRRRVVVAEVLLFSYQFSVASKAIPLTSFPSHRHL